MSDSTLPIPRQAPRPVPRADGRTLRRPAARTSRVRRRWGFVAALALMLATLPAHLLGLALVALEVLSPSVDGTEPVLIGGVGIVQLLLLAGVATAGQLIGGGADVWRRRMALVCLNALLVLLVAAVAWVLLLR